MFLLRDASSYNPKYFDSYNSYNWTLQPDRMDALSNVLSLLRVSSVLSSRFEGRGAWRLRFPEYRHVKFGSVLSGCMSLWIEGQTTPILMQEGDFYLLTDGRPFFSASDAARPAQDGVMAVRSNRGVDGVVRYQGEGDDGLVSLASGRFTFEDDVADLLLRHLPPLIHLPAAGHGAHALASVLELLRSETSGQPVGTDVASSSLAALTLVHALRAYLAMTRGPQGWLGALADPRIGKALTLMHDQPGELWSVESLATEVGMSRTAFAARFRRLVGNAPLDYLQRWRMTVARSALRNSEASLIEIALRVGYQSDTAFSIAFKRSCGESPGRFRAQARTSRGSTPP